jgi:hypothetical protein
MGDPGIPAGARISDEFIAHLDATFAGLAPEMRASLAEKLLRHASDIMLTAATTELERARARRAIQRIKEFMFKMQVEIGHRQPSSD